METVSVIIPTYNRSGYLVKALKSVLGQTVMPHEIIVVDDGSSDDTRSIVRTFALPVVYMRLENSGPAAARNAGIRRASGDFIAFLDSDDLWKPEKLNSQIRMFRRNPALSASHANFDWISEEDNVLDWSDAGYSQEGMLFTPLLLCKSFILLSSLMVRRECFEKVGFFDESLKTAEDTNFLMKLAKFYRFGYISEKMVLKRVHEGNLSGKAYDSFDNNDTFENLKRIFTVFPQPKRVRRLAYSKRYFHYGYHNFKRDNMRMARFCLMKSVGNGNVSPKALALLAFSWLPQPFSQSVRRAIARKEGISLLL